MLNMDSSDKTNSETVDAATKSKRMQILAAIVCSLLTFMYGHAIGWASSAVPQIESGLLSDGPIKPDSSGWIGGAFCLGALVSSPFHGLLADAKGRKFAAYVIALSYAANWAIILFTNSFAWLLAARVFAGIAGAGSVTIVSIYNNEIAELSIRSAIGGILALLYVSGLECAYILGAFLSYKTLAIVYLSINLAWFPVWWTMPETPAHLVLHGREKEALSTIRWLQGVSGSEANRILAQVREEQAGAMNSATIKEFFLDPAARKGAFLVGFLITCQSFSGAFAINSYAGSIFAKAGGGITAETGAMMFGLAMIVGALVTPLLADRAPRKVLLCISTFVMGIGMATFGTLQLFKSWMDPVDEENYTSVLPPIILSLTICSYFIGLGSIPYMTATELFSDENRGVAGASAAVVMWITSFIVLQFYGISVETFGDFTVFYAFTTVIYICFFFVIIFLPETRGKSFPEVQNLLLKRKPSQSR